MAKSERTILLKALQQQATANVASPRIALEVLQRDGIVGANGKLTVNYGGTEQPVDAKKAADDWS